MDIMELKRQVCEANQMLPKLGLVIQTWGNVSAFDQDSKTMIIKPSGVAYDELTPEKMVEVTMDGEALTDGWKPSSDTMTHLELYKNFPSIGSIVHVHSRWATVWAQMGRDIPPFGTTHADDFRDYVLCTRQMRPEEVETNYEINTGRVIVETLNGCDIHRHNAVLVRSHGPFIWDSTPCRAVLKAQVLEEVAMMAWHCLVCNTELPPDYLIKKHYERKHGGSAYYGQ